MDIQPSAIMNMHTSLQIIILCDFHICSCLFLLPDIVPAPQDPIVLTSDDSRLSVSVWHTPPHPPSLWSDFTWSFVSLLFFDIPSLAILGLGLFCTCQWMAYLVYWVICNHMHSICYLFICDELITQRACWPCYVPKLSCRSSSI